MKDVGSATTLTIISARISNARSLAGECHPDILIVVESTHQAMIACKNKLLTGQRLVGRMSPLKILFIVIFVLP
jgi:hypothetical protein